MVKEEMEIWKKAGDCEEAGARNGARQAWEGEKDGNDEEGVKA